MIFGQMIILIIALFICSFFGALSLFFIYDSFKTSKSRTLKIIKSIKDKQSDLRIFSLRGIDDNDLSKLKLFLYQKRIEFDVHKREFIVRLGTFSFFFFREELEIKKAKIADMDSSAKIIPFPKA